MAKSRIAEAYVQLIPSMDGFAKSIDRDLAKTSKLGSNVGAAIGGNMKTGIMSGLGGLAVGVGGLIASLGVGRFLNDTIQSASKLQDVVAAAGTVFGAEGAAIEKWATGAAKAFGATTEQALEAALTFGTFGKAAGLQGKDLTTFSTDLSQLAGDLASFRGTSTEDAITAVGAALRGEMEPIRAYGVLLDDATLKQEAMAMGIYDGNGALTQQQKVLAAQASIFKQTSDAQGDFARTSDSAANTQKTFLAEVENLKAAVGTELLPIFTDLVKALSDSLPAIKDALLPAVANLGAEFKLMLPSIIDFIKAFVAGKTPLNDFFNAIFEIFNIIKQNWQLFAMMAAGIVVFKGAVTVFTTISGLYKGMVGIIEAVKVAQIGLNVAMSANVFSIVILAIAAVVAALVWFFTQTEIGKQAWAGWSDFVVGVWNGLVDFFTSGAKVIGDVFTSIFKFIGEIFKGYINFWIGLFNGFMKFIASGINAIVGLVAGPLSLIGIKVPKVQAIQLPKLATGANIAGSTYGTPVIVGDGNKAETVTDLGTTNDMIKSTLGLINNIQNGTLNTDNNGGGKVVNINVYPSAKLDEKQVAEMVYQRQVWEQGV